MNEEKGDRDLNLEEGVPVTNFGGLPLFIGVKIIGAEPMNASAFKMEKGIVDNSEDAPGYKVIYEDGYTSWSPKNVFEAAYRRADGMNFGLAIEALKMGKKVARAGWNGKNLFVFKQTPAEIGLDIIPKMTNVPTSVKDAMLRSGTTLKYTNQMAIVNGNGRVDSWVASSSDTFADDWRIV